MAGHAPTNKDNKIPVNMLNVKMTAPSADQPNKRSIKPLKLRFGTGTDVFILVIKFVLEVKNCSETPEPCKACWSMAFLNLYQLIKGTVRSESDCFA